MAKMITRTFTMTRGTALVYLKGSQETVETEYAVEGKFSDDKKLEKAVEKVINADNQKLVAVLSTYEDSELRGMSVEDFIHYSTLMETTREDVEA